MTRNLIRICAVFSALLLSSSIWAQQVQLVVFDWNVKSFERVDKSGETTGFSVDEYVDKIRETGADVVCLNEFETNTSRMLEKEKMSELASQLGMYGYYIKSYPKDAKGCYGNVILSRYPIIASGSHLFPFKHYLGDGNYQWNTGNKELQDKYGGDQRSVGYADLLVPVSATESKVVRIVCSHFDNSGGSDCRTTQSEESVEFAGLASPKYPTIMCGDLNTTSDTELKALYDAGDHAGVNWVDHVFSFPKGAWSSSGFRPVSAGNLSDHDAVVVTMTLNE